MPTLGTVPKPDILNESPIKLGISTKFDWAGRLSLEAIRAHTKTDDIPGVTNQQLELYRDAAIEAAEMYTGLLLSGQRTITQPIQGPAQPRPGKMSYRVKLKYPVADGFVYLYGGAMPGANRTFQVEPGARSVLVPIVTNYLDLSNCCDPCSSSNLNAGMMAAYKAGYSCADQVPAGVVLGCLQFIAWVVEHPGDELLTQRNRIEARSVGVDGSNNIAWSSGALDTWRLYDIEAY